MSRSDLLPRNLEGNIGVFDGEVKQRPQALGMRTRNRGKLVVQRCRPSPGLGRIKPGPIDRWRR